MSKFANMYWSPDYKSGIENLSNQLLRSLAQLHELRKLIFNYMKLYHSNGEHFASLALESRSHKNNFDRRCVQESENKVSMSYLLDQYKGRSLAELHHNQSLASDIDRLILDKLTVFIKQYEPQILQGLDHMEELLVAYDSYYCDVENLKEEFDTTKRSLEFTSKNTHEEIDCSSSVGDDEVSALKTPISSPKREAHQGATSEHRPGSQANDTFKFPLSVGNIVSFEDASHFRKYFSPMISAIDVTRRAIPLPGYRNEIFSSEQLCDYFLKGKSKGFNPSRSNLERFGQGLIDLKIIVGTGFFAKKFASENKWYEWSDPFLLMLEELPQKSANQPFLPSLKLSSLNLDETHQYVNEVAQSTSKKFNGMFKSMKSSFMKSRKTEDALKVLEKQYNDAYYELQKAKHLLDVEIYHQSNALETFEKLKIEVVYCSLTKLLEVIYNHSLKSVEQMRDFTQQFVSNYNRPENYERDFEDTIREFACGVYFPSNISPQRIAQKHFTGPLNTNFQSINFEFNLFKDIPLQSSYDIAGRELLTNRSIPKFLYEAIKLIEKGLLKPSDTKLLWLAPLDAQSYWVVKSEIVSAVQNFMPNTELNTHSSQEIDCAMIDMIVDLLESQSITLVTNFFKNWCLEIGDSIIPSTVFDSLIGNYTNTNIDRETREDEMIRILITIPRSNLSSLVHILEHIVKFNDIPTLNGFQETDEIDEPNSLSEDNNVEELAASLNEMKAIGSVPLLHLLMRPSILKNSAGYIPPIDVYNKILLDLLRYHVRLKLFRGLLCSEKKHIDRQEQQKKNLGILKKTPGFVHEPTTNTRSVSENQETKIANITPKRISSLGLKNSALLNTENFELRPFRTGSTPRPSPISSPMRQRDSSDILLRSTSGNLLSPIEVTLDSSP